MNHDNTEYYVAMEPDDIISYANQTSNLTRVCYSWGNIRSIGVFYNSNPLEFSYSLLLLQLALSSGFILLISRILKLLGQPLFVSQFLAGLLLGPSFLGEASKACLGTIFPLRSVVLFDVIASFSLMFYFFVLGLQMDPIIIKKINKRTFSIGFVTVALPMILSIACAFLLAGFLTEAEAASLSAVSQAQSVLSFPMIAYFLTELKMLNSEIGRVALSASVVSNLCCFFVTTICTLVLVSAGEQMKILTVVCNAIVLISVICVTRSAFMWMMRQNPVGEPLQENYTIVLLVAILVIGFCSHAMGLHIYFGPFILGLVLPAGPPVGSTVTERLYLFTTWIFMPLYFVKTGLVIDITRIKLKKYLVVQAISLVAVVGKFMGGFLASLLCQFPTRDALCLGLVMTFQGVVELGLFKLMRKNKQIDDTSFMVMSIFIMVLAGGVAPIIRAVYDPSRRYVVNKKRSVLQSEPYTELRTLVSIHDQESVPATINILEALNPTKQSPLTVYMIHLVELAGRANPIFIHHKLRDGGSSVTCTSDKVVKAFRYFEQSNQEGLVSVFLFTAIAPVTTMHEDLCSIALHRQTSLIIVPFYKRYRTDGRVESAKTAVKITNSNVLEKAPCSVAILVDRGQLKTSRSIREKWYEYRIAVLFWGGDDDHETLAIAARMARHPSVHLTVIRLHENENASKDGAADTRLDNHVVDMFRTTVDNQRVTYREEMVMDGAETVSVLRSMESQFELIIVGRNHDDESPFLSGLTTWNENTELGAIGDILASADFLGSTTLLVVQQHNIVHTADQSNQMRYFASQKHVVYEAEADS